MRLNLNQAQYATTSPVQLESLVQNLSQNQLLNATQLHLSLTAPDGSTVFNDVLAIGQLVPGGQLTRQTTIPLNQAPVGNYTAVGRLLAADNQVLAQAQTQFTVALDLKQSLRGKVTVATTQITPGESQQCNFTLTNSSNQALTGLEVEQTVVAVEQQLIPLNRNRSREVLAHSVDVDTWNFATTGLAAGHYACVLQVKLEGVWESLGMVPFKVVQPVTTVETSATQGSGGRLLILLDAQADADCKKEDDKDQDDEKDHDGKDHDDDKDHDDGKDHGDDKGHDDKDRHSRQGKSSDKGHDDDHDDHDDDPDDHDDDHHHCKEDKADTATQRQTLQTLLTQGGWLYTLVESNDAFANELHSGNYTAYLLLSEQIHLDQVVQQELREAVYLGSSLLVAGQHDPRNAVLDEVLGIKYSGKSIKASGIAVTSPLLMGLSRVDFALEEAVLSAELKGATALASFQLAGKADNNPAVTTRQYGRGQTLYFGFDLLLQATVEGLTGNWAELWLQSLEYLHPVRVVVAGEVMPFQLTVQTEGNAVTGEAALTLSSEELVDAGAALWRDPHWVWAFAVLTQGHTSLTVWVRSAETAAFYRTEAALMIDGQPYPALKVEIPLQAQAGLEQALLQLTALGKQKDGKVSYQEVKKQAEAARQALLVPDYRKALTELLKATDKLVGGTRPETAEIRLMLDQALRQTNRQLLNSVQGVQP